jgi:hypothetical protein
MPAISLPAFAVWRPPLSLAPMGRSYRVDAAGSGGKTNCPYNPLFAWPDRLCQLESLASSRPSGLLFRYNNRHIKHAASNT